MVTLGVMLFLGALALGLILLWGGHRLTDTEVEVVAAKRRARRVLAHFSPAPIHYIPDPRFKSNLKADGRLYAADIPLENVASFAANLLKYKKHEWLVLAFICGRQCVALWANKGIDSTQVHHVVSIEEVVAAAARLGYDTLMEFHNHPASEPNLYRYHLPSEIDLATSARHAIELEKAAISYAAHVCERGVAYRYHLSAAPQLLPLAEIIQEVGALNGTGLWVNLRLHLEMAF